MSTSMSSTLMTMAQVASALPLHGMLPSASLTQSGMDTHVNGVSVGSLNERCEFAYVV